MEQNILRINLMFQNSVINLTELAIKRIIKMSKQIYRFRHIKRIFDLDNLITQLLPAVPGGPSGPVEGRLYRADGPQVRHELRHREARLAGAQLLSSVNMA